MSAHNLCILGSTVMKQNLLALANKMMSRFLLLGLSFTKKKSDCHKNVLC